MNNTLPKRRLVFIKKDFQGRFIVGAFALILLSGLCSAGLVYLITGGDLQAQSQSAHANLINATERLGISLLIGNLVSILIAGGIAITAVLYASHKIAGPLYRFEKLCQAVGEGNLDTITNLREKDQLQDMAQAFSTMVAKLRDRRDQRTQLIHQLNQQIGICLIKSGDNLTVEQQDSIAAIANLVNELEKQENHCA